MLIKVSDLPSDLRQKLPITLRLQEQIDTNILQLTLKREIEEFYSSNISFQPPDISQIHDISLSPDSYDVKHFTTKKDTIIDYIENYFNTPRGSYPFDPDFGTLFYRYIETKDTDFVGMMIANELSELIETLKTMFDVSIDVVNLNIYQTTGTSTTIYVKMDIKVNEEISSISITQ